MESAVVEPGIHDYKVLGLIPVVAGSGREGGREREREKERESIGGKLWIHIDNTYFHCNQRMGPIS